MDARQQAIFQAFVRFEGIVRIARWQAINEAIAGLDMPELTTNERDEIDLAAATGMAPFSENAVQ